MKLSIAIILLQVTVSVLALPQGVAEREVNPGLDLGWNDRDPIVGDDEWGLIDEQIESLNVGEYDIELSVTAEWVDDIVDYDVDFPSTAEYVVEKSTEPGTDIGAYADWNDELEIKTEV